LCLFGHVKNGNMILNAAGAMVKSVWSKIPQYYPCFDVDEFVVMPNHIHGILLINENDNLISDHKRAVTGNRPNEYEGNGPCAIPKTGADAGNRPNEYGGNGPCAIPKTGADAGNRPNEYEVNGPCAIPKTGADAGNRPNEHVGDGSRAIPDEVDSTKLLLSDVVGRFKSMVMTNYSSGVKEKGWSPFYKKLWHRSYYDHIIRNEKDYERIVEYIRLNPENWERDKNNLENLD